MYGSLPNFPRVNRATSASNPTEDYQRNVFIIRNFGSFAKLLSAQGHAAGLMATAGPASKLQARRTRRACRYR